MSKGGFTIIELLVVIAIIGLLSSVVLVSMQGVREKARDSARLQDIQQIQSAIELYYNKMGYYPLNTDNDGGNWDYGNINQGAGDTFIQPLIDEGFFSKVPIEATLNQPYYRYYLASGVDLGAGCGGRRTFYSIGVYLEKPQSEYGLQDKVNADCYPAWGWWQDDHVYGIVGYE